MVSAPPAVGLGDRLSEAAAGLASERDVLLRAARTLFYLGCLTVPTLALRPVAGVTLSDVLFGLSAAATACSLCRPRTEGSRPWQWAAVLVAVGGVLATVRAVSPVDNLAVTLRLLFIFAVWPWQVRILIDTHSRMTKAVRLFIVGAAASGIAALLQFRFGISLGASGVLHGRAVGLTGHVNDQGGLLAIALSVALGQIVYGMERNRVTKLGIAIFCGIGLVLSGSVSGMLAALVGVAVLALRKGVSVKVLLIGAAVLCIGWVAASNLKVLDVDGRPVTPLQRLSMATGGGRQDQNTLDSRIATDRFAVEEITKNPLIGKGLDEQSGLTVHGLQAHNIFVLAWFQGGPLVLLGELIALLAVARGAWSQSRARDPLRESLIAAFAAGVAFSMSAPTLYNRYFWLAPVFLLAASSRQRSDQE